MGLIEFEVPVRLSSGDVQLEYGSRQELGGKRWVGESDLGVMSTKVGVEAPAEPEESKRSEKRAQD